jgi:DNA invertase Pin-like site-specific DNA recombinase
MTATLRCAIYTRVSTDAGLEQDFNSLDAQRESAEAYIKSQAHEGWKLIRARYDDGGFSGGSIERPALQKLLDDVRARRIDVIVVYKVDRLTRSLADFAKLVELFDAQGVSFVSVTQAFNTTTSMGRLTLNVLLSFAQFEREVTGERIRDKIAASKKKGLWMGGVIPLGYRLEERKLYVDEQEAAIVRLIFELYLELGSVRALQRELKRRDIKTRLRVLASGEKVGGVCLTNGPLSYILHNRHYLGEINHRDRSWPGEHQAIIDPETFESVQRRLEAQRVATAAAWQKSRALLKGKVYNEAGERLTPSYAKKGDVRFGYYVSTSAMQSRDRKASPTHRLPAAPLEAAVVEALRRALGSEDSSKASRTSSMRDQKIELGLSPSAEVQRPAATDRHAIPNGEARALIDAHLVRVAVWPDRLDIEYRADPSDLHTNATLSVPWTKPPSRVRRALLEPNSAERSRRPMEVDEYNRLIRAIATGQAWVDGLLDGTIPDIAELSRRENRTPRSIRMTLSLAFLDPALIKAACANALPRGYGVTRLIDLPTRFDDQWRALGLVRPH